MKNVVLAIMLVAIGSYTYAQNPKVTSAGSYLNQGELIKAKVAIDEASVHPKTQGQPKTLIYVGKIYYAIAIDTTEQTKPYRDGAIFTSAEAFQAAKKVADSRTDETELNKYLYLFVYNKMWDEGVEFYNNKDYNQASKYFAGCSEIREGYDELDTLGYYYAANAAAAGEDHEKSIEYFSKIKGSGYKDGAIYANLASQYKALGDTAKAVEVLGAGRLAYPDNQQLLIAEFNIYVEMGETEKAIANIDKAIAADPEKASYYYVRGKLKESLGDLVSAEADYKKTLEIDPNHLDANHDLGALYVNESRSVVEEMNNLPLSAAKEYDAKKAELDGIYAKALPYLRKAYELDPNDTEVQGILMKLYLRTSDTENYNKIKADMEKGSAE